MPDKQFSRRTIPLEKRGLQDTNSKTLDILDNQSASSTILDILDDNQEGHLLEAEALMGKNIFLNETDLTKKIGVIRGDRPTVGNHFTAGVWNMFAAMYTIGSSDGSCGITFETRDKNSNHTVERMRIDASGNVGIGTASPSAKLEVNGDLKVTGNVSIGTTSPSAKLEVNGDLKVTGDIILTNADCAEDFDIVVAESIEPGTVMVIDNDGALRPSEQAYDKRVAGVISGAGNYRPGITLDRQKERSNRLPIALTGKVYCKVDAEYNPVEVGDLLTTSLTIGHAMKAKDRDKAFGAVIGKALSSLRVGRGTIPILVALQ